MSLKNPTFFAGQYRAVSFAYGVVPDVPGLEVDQPGAVGAITSTQTLSVACGTVTLQDGTVVSPLAVGTNVIVGTGTNADTVTVSAVSVGTPQIYQSANFTAATFTHAHGVGDKVSSATVGLQEAINYAALQGGGLVIVDAAWTQAGGTSAILSAAVVPPNVSIDDARNGLFASAGNTPGSVSQLAAPTAVSTSAATYGLLTTAATGGTIPASGTYRLGVTYVDAFGGETSLSIDTNALATIAVSAGSTNTISLTSPAALTGAVGYRVYMTAATGASLTEILYPVGNAAITGTAASASVLGSYGLPSFAIGTPVTINAIITGTAKVPAANTAYATGTISTIPAPVVSYPPFPPLGTIAAAATGTLGSINFLPGFLNTLGKTVRFKGMYYVTTNGTGGTITTELIVSSTVGVTSIIPFAVPSPAIGASTLTVSAVFEILLVTAAIGTSGTLEVHGFVDYNVAGTAVSSVAQDTVITVSSAVDLTKQLNLSFAHLNTTLGTTVSQLRQLTDEVLK
jgi:hypothetical protein